MKINWFKIKAERACLTLSNVQGLSAGLSNTHFGLSETILLTSWLMVCIIGSSVVHSLCSKPFHHTQNQVQTIPQLTRCYMTQPLPLSTNASLTVLLSAQTDLTILTFWYSLDISTLYLLLSQPRYSPLDCPFSFKFQAKRHLLESLLWLPHPFTPHFPCSFLHGAWLMLF